MKKKIITVLLASLMTFGAAACGKDGSTSSKSGPVEIDFWSTFATEKVLRDRTDLYDGVKQAAVVAVEACKGEYESTQIIMNPKSDIASYNAEWNDLNASGGSKFDKDNISVRVQKYIHVSNVYSGSAYNAVKGYYPDALVPIDLSAKAGENKIKAGDNQGLYITFNVPVDQPAGEYTGNLKITYDGEEKTLPVNLKVYDFEVSQETRSKSYFNLGFTQYLGELDSTDEIWRAYAEGLLEYRISPSAPLSSSYVSSNYRASYIEEAIDLVVNHGMSTINLPVKSGNGMAEYISELAKKSIEHNKNFVKMIIVKGPDEPNQNSSSDMANLKSYNTTFKEGRAAAVTAVRNLISMYPDKAEFINQLAGDAERIPSLITIYHGGRSVTLDETGVDSYCPTFDKYNTQADRDKYEPLYDGGERWWYGCIQPRPPYPSYHTEDHLLSARLVNWMMSEYNVVGNLYWAATVYAKYDGSKYTFIDDYYSGDALRFISGSGSLVNGDGYLFYPGNKYGVFGPLASLRLEAIRDGNEEYEILYDLKEMYEEAGFSADTVQRYISDLLYSGSTILHNSRMSANFAASRKTAIQLAMLAKSPAQLFITGVSDDMKGNISYEVHAKTGFAVKHNGQTLVQSGTSGDFSIYTVNISRTQTVNALALSVEAGGKEYRLDINIGGKVVHYGAADIISANNIFSGGNAITVSTDSGNVLLSAAATVNAHQFIRYTSTIFGAMDAGTEKIVIHFEDVSADTTFNILAKHSNDMLNQSWYVGQIPAGASQLTVNFSGLDWARLGKSQYIDIYLTPNNAAAYQAKTVKISGITVYSL